MAERPAPLHDADICELADLVGELIVERLTASVIPSSFPAEIGDWIREASEHGARLYRHVIPMTGPTAIFADWRIQPDGCLMLELQDTNGCPFWRGTFRPVDAERPPASGG
jgi:hypothetical protein